MGSFANSTHVMISDGPKVVGAIEGLMEKAGYRPTENLPAEGDVQDWQFHLRAFRIAKPSNGWVGILDSDLMDSKELAMHLSSQLGTYALTCGVNDSDSWQYCLLARGEQRDEFDSMDALDSMSRKESEDWRDSLAAMSADDDSSGGVYDMSTEKVAPEMRGVREEEPENEVPEPGRASRQDNAFLQDRVANLRPILPEDAEEEELLDILGTQAVFAEDTLETFLDLMGISPFFAYLSYEYAEEFGEADFADADIEWLAHLGFEKE
ncbi:MAG: hypothetical protein KGZ25_04440 [Planctomycetes bacterium]|nr:hypothetical protein [Planctomycetota bacterium]